MSAAVKPLAGVCVLVTRPAHQADALCKLLEHRGAQVVRFPTIDILPPHDWQAFDDIARRLDQFDIAVFVSPNAVGCALARIQLPANLTLAAVGNGSARALAQHGLNATLVPARADSDGLLELPALQQMRGRRVVIFRGEEGRGTLAEGLRERGADVEYAECYRRARPQTDASAIDRALAQGEIDAVVVTSVDALTNLQAMLAEPRALTRVAIVTLSERIRAACAEIGLGTTVLVAAGASDDAIVARLEAWRLTRKTL